MYNQGNYQQFGQRLPPPPARLQKPGPPPYGQPVSSQSYSIPHPPLQNPNWSSQGQHVSPSIPPHGSHGHNLNPGMPPPHPQGPHFYRVPLPLQPPTSNYFTPAPFGPFRPPAHESSLSNVPPIPQLPPSVPPGPPPPPPSDIPPPPRRPSDEETVRKIDVLCHYIAKNGREFEDMTCQKEVGNPDFEFLFGGEPGSEAEISHEYFKWMKMKCYSNELRPDETLHANTSHSPAGSDMDMEDDITQPEEPKNGPAFISNEVDKTVEERASDSENASHKDTTDGNVLRFESSLVTEQGVNVSRDDSQLEKSEKNVNTADSEPSLDSKAEQNNANRHQETNQSEQSPFTLIQGYVSDDDELHFENISPEAVSPHIKEHDAEFKNSFDLNTGSGPLSFNLTSKIMEPSTKTEDSTNRIDRQNDLLKGGDFTGSKTDEAKKKDDNVKLKVDEFGRIVKEGGNDSDSDSDDYYSRRRSKRGRSRSRSRSPNGRRRWSPQRRRDRHSRSRSWSPKRRSRSRSPDRSNRSNQQICYDHRFGKCFRHACRYYHEPDKSEKSRRYKNKQQYHEVPDQSRISDKLVPEKDKIDNQETQIYPDVSRSNDKVNEDFLEPQVQFADVASSHENYPPSSASSWNPLPPPPPPPPLPHHQHGGPVLQYHLNQPSFQTNYPLRALVTPYGPGMNTHLGVYTMNYPIVQRPVGPAVFSSSPNLISSNSMEPPPAGKTQSFSVENVPPSSSEGHAYVMPDFGRSRITTHYNPYASTFDHPMSTTFVNQDTATSHDNKYGSSGGENQILDEGQTRNFACNPPIPEGDQYDPLFDSVDPSSNSANKEAAVTGNEENDEFGETADGEVGAVENDSHSPSSPIDLRDVATTEVEIDQVKTKSKDSRSMKLFKVSLAEFVKEVLKPSWRQGNMSKEAFKTIVKKTVDKVSGAMKKHQVPNTQAKINHYIDSSQRKLTKLVMGYVNKYVKV